jgi:hypothetical protein
MSKWFDKIIRVWAESVGVEPYGVDRKFNKAIYFRTFAAWLNIVTCCFIIAAASNSLGLI